MNPVMIPYAIVNLALGLVAGFLARAGWFENPVKVFFAGLVIVIVAVLTSVPINVFLFGGVAHGTAGLLTGYLIAIGTGIWKAVFAVSFLRELADKLISVYIAFGIYKTLPPRYLSKFPGREK
jgi:energy-coupling factor transport system substrate-specific component